MKLGINPISWSNDDFRELGADCTLERCLLEAKEAGYAGVELGHKFPREPGALSPLLERYGVRLISGWFSGALVHNTVEDQWRALADHLELLSSLGCEVLIFSETSGGVWWQKEQGLSSRLQLEPSHFDRLCERIQGLAERCTQSGLQLVYHHHMGGVIQTEPEVDRLMRNTSEAVGLLLDTGHLAFAGGSALSVIEKHHRRIHHVHLKDLRTDLGLTDDVSFFFAIQAGAFCVPGDGSLDFASIVSALQARGYEGWWVVEADQDPLRAPPFASARRGLETIAPLLAAAQRMNE